MAKINLTDITSGFGQADQINANHTLLEAAIENSVSRDGTTPNNMLANLDMNSLNIINLADGVNNQDAATVAQLNAIMAAGLPAQATHAGKYLNTDGTTASWVFPDGSIVVFTPAGSIIATDVQAAIEELDSDVTTHTGDTTNPHSVTAAQIGVEDAATADQTGAEIKVAYELEADTNAFTDAEQTKLGNLPALAVEKTAATGSAVMPSGTTAQRDGTPADGYIRWNSTDGQLEHWDGAAWSALGGGGGGGYTYLVKTAAYTMVDSDGILADSTTAAFTLTLPITPALNEKVMISDGASAGSWGTNSVTVARNGETIEGNAGNYILDINNGWAEFVFDGSTWQVRTDFASGSSAVNDYIMIRDETTDGTDGGTFTNGAARTRVLNTIASDSGGHASLSSNQITLVAGTYRFRCRAPAYSVNAHRLWLQDITGAAVQEMGVNAYATAAAAAADFSEVVGEFTIASSNIFELQHQCQTSKATNGLGIQDTMALGVEIYAVCEFWKVA